MAAPANDVIAGGAGNDIIEGGDGMRYSDSSSGNARDYDISIVNGQWW
jgi:hypothetical protein